MYSAPNPERFRDWLREHNLTGAAAAAIVGADSRTVRRWTAPREQAGARSIPWAAWMLLRLHVGEISVEDFRSEVAQAERA